MFELKARMRVAPFTLTRSSSNGALTFGPASSALGLVLAPLIQGPTGPRGPQGNEPIRFDVSVASGSWTVAHNLGRVPAVSVYLGGGELALADIQADSTHVSAVFAAPQTGFLLLH